MIGAMPGQALRSGSLVQYSGSGSGRVWSSLAMCNEQDNDCVLGYIANDDIGLFVATAKATDGDGNWMPCLIVTSHGLLGWVPSSQIALLENVHT